MKDTDPIPRKQSGFTLIELLVALTIFVVLSALGWQVFDQLQKTREHVSVQSEALSELQYAYMQLNRDVAQYVNRVGHSIAFKEDIDASTMLNMELDGDMGSKTFSVGLDIFENQLSFTRKANLDPRYIGADTQALQGEFERVTYKLHDEKLMRYSSKTLDNPKAKPLPSVLLQGVKNLRVSALDPGVIYAWPPEPGLLEVEPEQEPTDEEILQEVTQLPLGIEISFEYMDMPITWRFALVTSLPKIKPPKIADTKSGSNTGSSSDKGGNETGGKGSQQDDKQDDKKDSTPAKPKSGAGGIAPSENVEELEIPDD